MNSRRRIRDLPRWIGGAYRGAGRKGTRPLDARLHVPTAFLAVPAGSTPRGAGRSVETKGKNGEAHLFLHCGQPPMAF